MIMEHSLLSVGFYFLFTELTALFAFVALTGSSLVLRTKNAHGGGSSCFTGF